MESDKESIHKEILSQSERWFEKINSSVKRIRLDYLLDYPVHKIQSNAFIRDLHWSADNWQINLIIALVLSLIICWIVLPLVEFCLDLFVRLIHNQGLRDTWESLTEVSNNNYYYEEIEFG